MRECAQSKKLFKVKSVTDNLVRMRDCVRQKAYLIQGGFLPDVDCRNICQDYML